MRKLLPVFATLLLLSSQAFAGDTHLWFVQDVKGDPAGFVEMANKFNTLATKLVPDNHPDFQIIQSTYAGSTTGTVFQIVEFDDLADVARVMGVLEANKEAMALQAEINSRYPAVAMGIAERLLYLPGQRGNASLVFAVDVKGDVDGFIEMMKQTAALDAKITGGSPPTISVMRETYAGSLSGDVFAVIEFKDLETLARTETQHAASKEWMSLIQDMERLYPTKSMEINAQLSYRSGTK